MTADLGLPGAGCGIGEGEAALLLKGLFRREGPLRAAKDIIEDVLNSPRAGSSKTISR